MAILLTQSSINELADSSSPIVFFGSGAIAEKTAEKYGVYPQYVVDNSRDSQGLQVLGVQVTSPAELLKTSKTMSYVICSTSIDQIEGQLLSHGVDPEDIYISPKLREYSIISDFESYQFDLLFTSGLQDLTPEGTIGGGGLYRVKGQFDNYSITKISSGSSHGMYAAGDFIYVVNETYGVAKYDRSLELVDSYSLPDKLRPHGITYCPKQGIWALACSLGDCILLMDDHFSEVNRIYLSDRRHSYSGKPQHHTNDLCCIGDELFVSMFSTSGHWKRNVFDGGVHVYNLESLSKCTSLYGDLRMPHSVSCFDNQLWVLDSLRKQLYRGNDVFLSNMLSFSRGLEFSSDLSHVFVGQSKNRNFSSLSSDQFSATSLDTAITIVRLDTMISRNITLPSSISEIHSIVSLNRSSLT